MKLLRTVLISLGAILILLAVVANIITPVNIPEDEGAAYISGTIVARLLFFVPGALLLFFANKIKKRLNKKAINALLESLPQ
ncbi:hypothetical protein [Flavisolibacter tropicus]|uniref:Uncharacterized protein n=1 Tax=Flavisolibacter tropicus TaxID=1492898 RepID=A0A172U0Z0_9BACT|nr:hypothetical protein [Flavisolibacter tropicus]ANE53021.1 hypothetical protein SY85_23645 [Flavisolibacter tropicus]